MAKDMETTKVGFEGVRSKGLEVAEQGLGHLRKMTVRQERRSDSCDPKHLPVDYEATYNRNPDFNMDAVRMFLVDGRLLSCKGLGPLLSGAHCKVWYSQVFPSIWWQSRHDTVPNPRPMRILTNHYKPIMYVYLPVSP